MPESEWEPDRAALTAGAAEVAHGVPAELEAVDKIAEAHQYLHDARLNVAIGCSMNDDGSCLLTIQAADPLPEWSP